MATFLLVLQALPYIAGAATSVIALVQTLKARDYKKSGELTDKTCKIIVGAIDLLPQDERTGKIKRTIEQASKLAGTEIPKLGPMVEEVCALLKKAGLGSPRDETDIASIQRAVIAIKQAENEKNNPPLPKLPMGAVLLLIGILGLFSLGCATPETRLTKEMVFEADTTFVGQPKEIVIEWPEGIREADVSTQTVDSRTLTVARVVEPARNGSSPVENRDCEHTQGDEYTDVRSRRTFVFWHDAGWLPKPPPSLP